MADQAPDLPDAKEIVLDEPGARESVMSGVMLFTQLPAAPQITRIRSCPELLMKSFM